MNDTSRLSVKALTIGVILCIAACHAAAERGRPALPGATLCPTPLEKAPGPWSDQETWAWDERICLGKVADLSKRDPEEMSCHFTDSTAELKYSDAQVITAKFMQTVMFHAPFRDALTRAGISIRCAAFLDQLDLSKGDFEHSLTFEKSYFAQGVRLTGLSIRRSLSLLGSRMAGEMAADDLVLGGTLFVDGNSRFDQGVTLSGVEVGGDLRLRHSDFSEPVVADSALIAGDVRISSRFKRFSVIRASVGGDFDVGGSVFEGKLVADGVAVGGRLFGAHGVDRAEADAPTFQDASFRGARVAGDIDLSRITIGDRGKLDLSDARSDGKLVFGRELCLRDKTAALCSKEDSRECDLHLRNLVVHMLVLHEKTSWAGFDGRLHVLGFKYDGLQQIPSGYPRIGAIERLVNMQYNPTSIYQPGPYRQLEETLRSNGYDRYAKVIVFEMFKHERKAVKTRFLRKAVLLLGEIIIGYGYNGWISIFWIVGLVALGGAFAAKSPLSCGTWGQRIYYRLDKAIPLISVDKDHDRLSVRGWSRGYFCFHTILGFVLISVFIGSAVGVIR